MNERCTHPTQVWHRKGCYICDLEKANKEIEQLKELLPGEWSMGNGQCPYCYGLSPHETWGAGRDVYTGHEIDCPRVAALGGIIMVGRNDEKTMTETTVKGEQDEKEK